MLLLHTLPTIEPCHPILAKLLDPRLQFRLMQAEIIHSPNSQYALSWVSTANPIHQRTAHRTEVVCHGVPCGDGLILAEFCELVLATKIGNCGVVGNKVASEHASSDFVTVGAVADEAVY